MLGDRRGAHVRTADLVAKVQQNFGNAAHTDTANPDKVHVFDSFKHLIAPMLVDRSLNQIDDSLFGVQDREAPRVAFDFLQPRRVH